MTLRKLGIEIGRDDKTEADLSTFENCSHSSIGKA